jgi:hypothetical protein
VSGESQRVRFIEHDGCRILYIDFSRATAEEVMETIEIAERTIGAEPLGSVLTLTNTEKTMQDRRVTERLRSYVEHNKPYVKAGAVVGLSELRKIVFGFLNKATGRSLRAFDTLAEARTWLVRQ